MKVRMLAYFQKMPSDRFPEYFESIQIELEPIDLENVIHVFCYINKAILVLTVTF